MNDIELKDTDIMSGVRWILRHIVALLGGLSVVIALAFSYAFVIYQVAEISEMKKDLKETREAVIEMRADLKYVKDHVTKGK